MYEKEELPSQFSRPDEKRSLFLSFPYVCPEPVLVKCSSIYYVSGPKRPFLLTREVNAGARLRVKAWARPRFVDGKGLRADGHGEVSVRGVLEDPPVG
eukprot:COSAG06_NODE_24256_length_668_cov_0.966608_1_plen_97_part_10